MGYKNSAMSKHYFRQSSSLLMKINQQKSINQSISVCNN